MEANYFTILYWFCHAATAAAKSLQSCPTLCDLVEGSPPGSPVPGILQARTLEWVAISFSNSWKWKVKVKSLSPIWLFATPWTAAYQAPPSMGFSRQEYWSGVPLVLPYINMNPPQVYTCSPSWTPLPPPSPYHPSGSSQCTSPEHPVSCNGPGLAIHFIYDIIHVSMPFSLIIPPSPSPTESKRLFYTSLSLLLSHIQDYHYHLSKFHMYALVYCIREKAMAPHSSTLAWKIPWMEEPGRLQSMGSLELDTTERLHFHFSLSCIGEGNGNPLQCSCLENPRDGEA